MTNGVRVVSRTSRTPLATFFSRALSAALQVKSSWLARKTRPTRRFGTGEAIKCLPRARTSRAYASRCRVPRSTRATPNLRETAVPDRLLFEFRRVRSADRFQTRRVRLARSRRLSLRSFPPPRGIVSARLFDPPRIPESIFARESRERNFRCGRPLELMQAKASFPFAVCCLPIAATDDCHPCTRASGDRLVFIIFTFVGREHPSIMQPHLFRFNSH